MIKASIIENSRKEKTTQVDYNGFIGSCPSGASTGKNETPIFRKKIDTEVKEFNQIAKSLEKIEINKFGDLKLIEEKLKDFGANIIISTEFAILHSKQGYKWINSLIDFPKPLGNVIGGGAHFKGKGTSFQEFLVVDNNSKSFLDSSLTNKKIHLELREELEVYDNKFNGEMTDEGAWAPTQLEDEDVLKIVFNVAKKYNIQLDGKLSEDANHAAGKSAGMFGNIGPGISNASARLIRIIQGFIRFNFIKRETGKKNFLVFTQAHVWTNLGAGLRGDINSYTILRKIMSNKNYRAVVLDYATNTGSAWQAIREKKYPFLPVEYFIFSSYFDRRIQSKISAYQDKLRQVWPGLENSQLEYAIEMISKYVRGGV